MRAISKGELFTMKTKQTVHAEGSKKKRYRRDSLSADIPHFPGGGGHDSGLPRCNVTDLHPLHQDRKVFGMYISINERQKRKGFL